MMRRSVVHALFVLLACAPAVTHAAVVINFPNFANCATLQVNANAACTSNVLRVTPATFSQAGSAFSQTAITLGPGNTFSTFFSFRITNSGGSGDGDGLGADGITFTVQPVANTAGGLGGGIGYAGIPNSVAIEFDTWNNGLPGDPDGNHVGVDLNGSVSSVVAAPVATRLNDGNVWYAWVDYDGSVLQVRLSQANARPAAALISHPVNLATVIGTPQAFVGFTSGTGAAFADHDILSWTFDNAFAPIGGPQAPPSEIPTLSQGAIAAAVLTLAALGMRRLRRD
ncbi:MAG TPA: PEP-CTERM sorting domain-containing protein [Casimicrobiaceae bacterium]|nr:PEP-CTERM sorting domain-containing protein [Casimicrobiaceae bacterium]